ncbi:MAG: hypothetical protein CMF72_19770 [Mameliella sp.]|nr:hypothetical protein [Mameliella sp.]
MEPGVLIKGILLLLVHTERIEHSGTEAWHTTKKCGMKDKIILLNNLHSVQVYFLECLLKKRLYLINLQAEVNNG